MCTAIIEKADITGSGKGTAGWFKLNKVNVSYDHPYHAHFEHTLNLDFRQRSPKALPPESPSNSAPSPLAR